MNARYRVQLPPDAAWSEWRDLSVPISEPLILSVQIEESATRAQVAEFMAQIKVPG